MKYLVIACLIFLSANAYPEVRVEIEGTGKTEALARQDAFDKAITQTMGQIIVSDKETDGKKLTKYFIGSYSAAYILDYKQLDKKEDTDSVTVRLSVLVASSKIADRMTTRSQQSSNVNGLVIQETLNSQLQQLNNGDALLQNLLTSYPENAYVINSGRTEYDVDNLRQPYVDIPFNISMNINWINALNESADLISIKNRSCSTLMNLLVRAVANPRLLERMECSNIPDLRIGNNHYYFADLGPLYALNGAMKSSGQQHIGLKADLLDYAGNVIDSRCGIVRNDTLIHYEYPSGTYDLADMNVISRPFIKHKDSVYGTLRINIKNTEQFEKLAKIKLSIQHTCY